ncbi:hypothetical protein DOY81_012817, partial [Sarcophaga bullata]
MAIIRILQSQMRKAGQYGFDVQARQFHASCYTASKVALSKFDTDVYLPYEKLSKTLEIV